MSSSRKIDKWLLVQWNSGGRGVVNANDVGAQREPKVGTVVNVPGPEGERQTGTVIGNSRKSLFPSLFTRKLLIFITCIFAASLIYLSVSYRRKNK